MAIELRKLEKGQRIVLEKNDGAKLLNFCVGCNWGAVVRKGLFRKKVVDVDLDLSCIMFNAAGEVKDHIWSPLYMFGPGVPLPKGRLTSKDGALHHTGDDLAGDRDGDDGLDNEIITVDLRRVDPEIQQIVFFLNIYRTDEFKGDFSDIPYASIRMYEGTATEVKSVFAQYDVATRETCRGKHALVLGKIYRRNGDWKFAAIGDAFDDVSISLTIYRVMAQYNK